MAEAKTANVVRETTFDREECYQYIIDILGNEQRIPARFNINDGTTTMIASLKARYGPSEINQYLELLNQHLSRTEGTSTTDRSLWRQWRADFEITGV